MQVSLPFDKTTRLEVYFEKPTLKVRDLSSLDSLMCSSRAPTLVVTSDYTSDINMIRSQRNSPYKLITAIDPECKEFGGSKIYRIQNLIESDGFDIGLTANKNKIELINEIKGISSFLQQLGNRFSLRWVVNTKFGNKHIDNCLDAIKESKCRYELIVIDTNNSEYSLSHDLVKSCREKLGLNKCVMKVDGQPIEKLINQDINLFFKIKAEDL